MTNPRFSAVTLDLSRLPIPQAILGIDYESILSARIASLKTRLTAVGIPYDVEQLNSDPAVILQQEDAYRQLLDLASINDAVRSVMVAFATKADLDHLAAFYGLTRGIVVQALGETPAVLETDDEFRLRVLLAPEAFSNAGSVLGYAFHALTADAQNVRYVDVWSPAPGEVTIALQSRAAHGVASQSVIDAVTAQIQRDDIKPLCDVVTVRSAEVLDYQIDVRVLILPGPDPVAVKAQVEASLSSMASSRFTPTRDVPVTAVIAASQIGAVDKVIVNSPSHDVARGRGQSARCSSIKVTVETYDG